MRGAGMGEELGTVPLTTPSIDPEKLLDYLEKLDGVAFALISKEGLPVYIRGQLDKDEAEALAALGEEAFRRIEESFGKLGGGKVSKLGLDVAQGRLYISRLNGGVLIYRASSPRLADAIAEIVERLRENRPVKCENCGHDLTLETYRCPRCGRTVPFIVNECPHCGANLSIKRCPKCGAMIHSDGRLARIPKTPLYLGYAAAGVTIAVGGLAVAMGAVAAGAAAIVAGLVLGIGTLFITKRA